MKRIVLEWGLLAAIGTALAISALWGFSRFVDRSTYHLRFPTSRSVQDDLHLLVGDGDLTFCDQFDVGASGNVRPLIVHARDLTASDLKRGDRVRQFTIPGLDLRYYRMGDDGYMVWSLRLSLLIPVMLSFLLAFAIRRRLKASRNRITFGPAADLDRRPGASNLNRPERA